mmetsp:Transcript_62458/g.193814  ORF Transcript_62458/g.193814 Transcript_62458/m.193814 type:complete len:270 (-) Transcript_62458:42-851(-)
MPALLDWLSSRNCSITDSTALMRWRSLPSSAATTEDTSSIPRPNSAMPCMTTGCKARISSYDCACNALVSCNTSKSLRISLANASVSDCVEDCLPKVASILVCPGDSMSWTGRSFAWWPPSSPSIRTATSFNSRCCRVISHNAICCVSSSHLSSTNAALRRCCSSSTSFSNRSWLASRSARNCVRTFCNSSAKANSNSFPCLSDASDHQSRSASSSAAFCFSSGVVPSADVGDSNTCCLNPPANGGMSNGICAGRDMVAWRGSPSRGIG